MIMIGGLSGLVKLIQRVAFIIWDNLCSASMAFDWFAFFSLGYVVLMGGLDKKCKNELGFD